LLALAEQIVVATNVVVLTVLTQQHLVIPLLVAVQVQVSLAVQAVVAIVQIDHLQAQVLRGKVIMAVLLLVVTILRAVVVVVLEV
jgi:hypothetical protein